MLSVHEQAPAKVNLDLCITGRRADGYHELDSLVVFAAPADRLTLRQHDRLVLEVAGAFSGPLAAENDNLVLRAARRLAACVGRPPDVRITLDKRIPVAAGLGGGSADAAATLRGLNRLWQLDLSLDDLLPIAAGLGADVPVCLLSRPARMRGIGERLQPLDDFPELHLLLIHPDRPLATAAVFGALDELPPAQRWPDPPQDSAGLITWLGRRSNDLQAPARRLLPEIDEVLDLLGQQPGCRLARMSGSGAACFGLFESADARLEAAATIRSARPEWWVAP